MAGKYEDFFGKKKEVATILDLSKCTINSKEELRRTLEKVPDYKMRAVKVKQEDIKIKEKDFKFKTSKKEIRAAAGKGARRKDGAEGGTRGDRYVYMDPTPTEMRGLCLEDFSAVPIDWKMLTTLRPKSKVDEDLYSRMVELSKLQLKTVAREKREAQTTSHIRRSKNRAGVVETRVISCNECLEEFCDGKTCGDFSFDCYSRIKVPEMKIKLSGSKETAAIVGGLGATKRKKGKGGKSAKTKSPTRGRSKSGMRSPKKKGRSKSGAKSDGEC